MDRFKPNQVVRINDTQSEYHKMLAKVVKVGQRSYDVAEHAAAKRASLDLTRVLAKLRANK